MSTLKDVTETHGAELILTLARQSGWTELERLTFTEAGSIDWTVRHFAKRWSMRRLGRAGVVQLAEEHVPLNRKCHVFRSDSAETEVTTLRRALAQVPRGAEQHWWLVSVDGRWLVELSSGQTFTFEFASERNTRMLQRLEGLEKKLAAEAREQANPYLPQGLDQLREWKAR